MIRKILEYIFPNFTCLGCVNELHNPAIPNVCEHCFSKFKFNNEQSLPASEVVKGLPNNTSLAMLYSPFFYRDPIKGMILQLKYANNAQIAASLSPFLAKTFNPHNFDVLVPVPLSKKRQRERGYNQSELLAHQLSLLTNLPVRTDILKRIRSTTPQENMSHEQRHQNQHGSFEVVGNAKWKILLVDDVFTSGATLNECARVLKNAGATDVCAVTIARV